MFCQAACHGKTEHGICFAKPLVMAKLNMAYVLLSRLSWQNWTWHMFCQAACHGKTEHGISFAKPLVMAKLNMAYVLPSRLSWQNWTWHMFCQAACHGKTEHGIFVKFKKPSKTAVVILVGVTISGTPCPRHCTVPFGAEAPSDHVVQAWAIPPPAWGLLSQWHRRETTTPETNGATFLSDFALYMITNYAIIWKRCLNYTARITLSTPMTPVGVIGF